MSVTFVGHIMQFPLSQPIIWSKALHAPMMDPLLTKVTVVFPYTCNNFLRNNNFIYIFYNDAKVLQKPWQ